MSTRSGKGGKAAKHSARGAAASSRASLSAVARAEAADAVAARVLAIPEATRPGSVLAYAATPEELDAGPLVRALRERGARVAYPRVCDQGELTLHWREDDALAPGFCGIPEPSADDSLAAAEEIDMVIVPGVAFDESCCRLGRGGGFYDRLLRRLRPDALTVGVTFDEQVVDALPLEEHDTPVDLVVTPTRTLRRR